MKIRKEWKRGKRKQARTQAGNDGLERKNKRTEKYGEEMIG